MHAVDSGSGDEAVEPFAVRYDGADETLSLAGYRFSAEAVLWSFVDKIGLDGLGGIVSMGSHDRADWWFFCSLLSSRWVSATISLFTLEAETKYAVLVVVIRIHVLCNYTYII